MNKNTKNQLEVVKYQVEDAEARAKTAFANLLLASYDPLAVSIDKIDTTIDVANKFITYATAYAELIKKYDTMKLKALANVDEADRMIQGTPTPSDMLRGPHAPTVWPVEEAVADYNGPAKEQE